MKKTWFAGLLALVAVFSFAAREASACDKCKGKEGQSCSAEKSGDCGCKKDEAAGECSMKKSGTAFELAPAATGVAADKIGQEATCPVTGEKFKISAQTTFSEYKGATYYFCCPGCKPKFDKDPARYAK